GVRRGHIAERAVMDLDARAARVRRDHRITAEVVECLPYHFESLGEGGLVPHPSRGEAAPGLLEHGMELGRAMVRAQFIEECAHDRTVSACEDESPGDGQ